jgi:hypothetical protein
MKFKPNFSAITGRLVRIQHFSTSSTVEITVSPTDPEEEEKKIHLDYMQLDSLIDVIKSIEDDEHTGNT